MAMDFTRLFVDVDDWWKVLKKFIQNTSLRMEPVNATGTVTY